MVCKDAQELIHGYIDGELDPFGNLEVERHLEGCEACSAVYKREQALHSLMQNPSLKFKPPAGLRRTIESAVRKADKAERRRRWTSRGGIVADGSPSRPRLHLWRL